MNITNISNLKFNIKQNLASLKKENVTSSISNANNFSLYDRALSNYNQINFMAKSSISKEELQDYISKHPEQNQEEIGRYFHVVGATIGNLIRKYGIEYNSPTKIYTYSVSKEKLSKYIKEHPNQNQAEIAQHFNVASVTIGKLIRQYEIEYLPHPKASSISEKKLRTYMEQHPDENQEKLANYFEITVQTLRNLFKKYGIEYHSHKLGIVISKEELEKYIKEHPEDNVVKVAEYFNTSDIAIGKLIRKYKIDYRPHKTGIVVSKEELEKYIKEHPEENQGEIGKHFGVRASIICQKIKQYGISYTSQYGKHVAEKELREYISKHPDESQREIAHHFGISTNAIHYEIKKYNIEYKPNKNGITEKELREYISKHPDESQKEIGDYFGVSGTTIGRLIKKYKINYQAHTEISEEKLVRYVCSHPFQTREQIAQYFGVANGVINNLIEKYGIRLDITKKDIVEYAQMCPKSTLREMVEYFKVSPLVIKNALKNCGIECNKTYISEKTFVNYILEHPNQTHEQIAKHFNIPISEVFFLIQQYGIELKN